MTTYALTINGVIRLDDGASIPNNPDNADWQQYQRWLTEEGNSARPIQPSDIHVWNGTAWIIDTNLGLRSNATAQLSTDVVAVKADAAILAFLKMTPAEIDAYVNTQFPGGTAPIPNLRVVLKILGKTLAVLARREIADMD